MGISPKIFPKKRMARGGGIWLGEEVKGVFRFQLCKCFGHAKPVETHSADPGSQKTFFKTCRHALLISILQRDIGSQFFMNPRRNSTLQRGTNFVIPREVERSSSRWHG